MITPKNNLDLIQELQNSTEVLHGTSKKRLHNFLTTIHRRIASLETNHTPTFASEIIVPFENSTTIFQLAQVPISNSLDLYKVVIGTGLVLLIPDTDYILNGKQVKLAIAPGVKLLAKYRY